MTRLVAKLHSPVGLALAGLNANCILQWVGLWLGLLLAAISNWRALAAFSGGLGLSLSLLLAAFSGGLGFGWVGGCILSLVGFFGCILGG